MILSRCLVVLLATASTQVVAAGGGSQVVASNAQVVLAKRVLDAIPSVFSLSMIWPSLPVEKRMAAIKLAQELVTQSQQTPGYDAFGAWSSCWALANTHREFVSDLNVAASGSQSSGRVDFFQAASLANQAFQLGGLRTACAAKAGVAGGMEQRIK